MRWGTLRASQAFNEAVSGSATLGPGGDTFLRLTPDIPICIISPQISVSLYDSACRSSARGGITTGLDQVGDTETSPHLYCVCCHSYSDFQMHQTDSV